MTTTIERFLNGRNAVSVLTELGFYLDTVEESITFENGKYFVSDMKSTESETLEECLAKAEILYLLADGKIKEPLLHFIAVKNGHEFHYHEKTEYDARTRACSELGSCSDFYQVNEKGERI